MWICNCGAEECFIRHDNGDLECTECGIVAHEYYLNEIAENK
nr:hypothetical protein [uncultured Cetobacterium sp.]